MVGGIDGGGERPKRMENFMFGLSVGATVDQLETIEIGECFDYKTRFKTAEIGPGGCDLHKRREPF